MPQGKQEEKHLNYNSSVWHPLTINDPQESPRLLFTGIFLPRLPREVLVGVTIPGSLQEMYRYGTEGHSLVGSIHGKWMVGLDIRGLFQILSFYDYRYFILVCEENRPQAQKTQKGHRKRGEIATPGLCSKQEVVNCRSMLFCEVEYNQSHQEHRDEYQVLLVNTGT